MPDPSVYTQMVPGLCIVSSCSFLAAFLSPHILTMNGGFHQGGFGYGWIVSIVDELYCGKVLVMYSRVVMWTLLCDLVARWILAWIGFVGGYVCIRVRDLRILGS